MQLYDSTRQPPFGVTIVDRRERAWVRVVHGWWNPGGDPPVLAWPDLQRDRGPLRTNWRPPPAWLAVRTGTNRTSHRAAEPDNRDTARTGHTVAST